MNNGLISNQSFENNHSGSTPEQFEVDNLHDFIKQEINTNRKTRIDPNMLVPFSEDEKKDYQEAKKDGGTVFSGSESDLKEDEKIGPDQAKAFFEGSDTKPEIKDVPVSADSTSPASTVATEEPGFTIDKESDEIPKDIAPKKEQFNIKAFLTQEIGEEPKPKPEVKVKKNETDFELMVDLRNEIDKYNQLFAKSNRLEKDIEKRATQQELAKLEIINTIRSAIFSTEYHTSVGRTKLAHLADTLEDEVARKEAGELNTDIDEIELIKDNILEKLDILLRRMTDQRRVDALRIKLGDLIFETEMNKTEPQNFKAGIESMCGNRIDEIIKTKNLSAIKGQIDEIGAKKEADSTKSKIDDKIHVGSAGLADAEESAKTSTEEIKKDVEKKEEPVDENKGDKKSTDQIEVKDEITPALTTDENKSVDPATVEPPKGEVIPDSKPTPENIYENIATEAAKDDTKEQTEASKPLPEPLVKPGEFQEMVRINGKGEVETTDFNKHEEIGLNKKNDLYAEKLTKLVDRKDQKIKGVVNLTPDDLKETVELPRHSNKLDEARANVTKTKNQPQAEVDSDIFGDDDEKIVGVDRVPLIKEHATAENPVPTVITEEIIDEQKEGKKDNTLFAESTPDIPASDVGQAEISEPENRKMETEKPQTDKLGSDEVTEKGPDLSAETPTKIADNQIISAPNLEEKPLKTKKVRLFERLKQIVGLGENIDSKTVSGLADAVADERNHTVEEIAEQPK